MKKVTYMKILDNCGCRKYFEPSVLKKYIEKYPNWEEFILKRHHAFLDSYIKEKYILKFVANNFKCQIRDLESILLRVQSQFEIYDLDKNVQFEDLILDYNNLIFEWQVKEKKTVENVFPNFVFDNIKEVSNDIKMDIEDVKIKNIQLNEFINRGIKINKLNINTKNADRDKKIIKVLQSLEGITNLPEILSPTLYKYTNELVNGLSFDEICTKHKKTKQYLITTIHGKPKYRYPSEKGLALILEESKDKIRY